MSADSQRDLVMAGMKESLAANLVNRVVTRNLRNPGDYKADDLKRGILVLVAAGGGNFANWQGREGELGTIRFKVVGYVVVPEKAEPLEIERAEHQMLEEYLAWVGEIKAPPLDALYPGNYQQSNQLEHPYGWFALDMEARFV